MNFCFRICILFIIVFHSCKNDNILIKYSTLQGKTMGTYYNITYKGTQDIQKDIDQELQRVNNKLSTYIPTSTISKFNKSIDGIKVPKKDLFVNVQKAKELYSLSNGYYDPSVMPLVNYWGFGYTGHEKVTSIDSFKIDSLIKFIGFDKINFVPISIDSIFLHKRNKQVQLDLSSIAKGYGVDQIAKLLEENNIKDYLVEIGGEVYCSGLSPKGKKWVLGVNTPKENAATNEIILKKELSNQAMATSGNYRNFYNANGNKYSHTINPKTGFPERSNLLSATIITSDCMTADAFATACMVSGLKWSKKIIENTDSIQGILIYLNNNNKMEVWQKD